MKELYVDRSFFEQSLEQVTASVGQVAMEIEILSKLEHPNIVKYYESFMENDRLYIIMVRKLSIVMPKFFDLNFRGVGLYVNKQWSS